MSRNYYAPTGGLPPQTQLLTDRAMFTEAYAVIPKGTFSDIVTSFLPFWEKTRLWVIARPLSGFAETFSQYIMEVQPGGGSDRAELDEGAEGVLFVVEGEVSVTVAGKTHRLDEGGYAYLPPKSGWRLRNEGATTARFHWIRKAYEYVDGLDVPEPLFLNEKDIAPSPMPDTGGAWATTRFVDPNDLRPRHACDSRDLRAGGRDSLCRNPCDGTRTLCAGRQGRLSAQPGLGGSGGRRFHVAARLLPAGLLCRRPRQVPLSAL